MKIIPLYSGSSGNATIVKSDGACVLIDAGVSVKRLLEGLKMHGESLESISALLLTHTHNDHIAGVQKLVFQKPHLKVYGGGDAEKYALCTGFEKISADSEICVGDMKITTFPVPHDVPCFGFAFEDGKEKVGYATDIGEITPQTLGHLMGSKTVMIEANYDDTLLASGEYPIFLKRRIASNHGHLSNLQSGEACVKLLENGTKNFILAHLSEKSNTPETAYNAVQNAFLASGAKMFEDYRLCVAKRSCATLSEK